MNRSLDVDPVAVHLCLMRAKPYSELTSGEKAAVVHELHRKGITSRQAETLYGVDQSTFSQQVRRWVHTHRIGPMKPAPDMTVPDGEPACKGHDPVQFTTLPIQTAVLDVCRPCTVKDWCLATVRPRSNHFDGIAGGIAWRHGRPIARLAPTAGDVA